MTYLIAAIIAIAIIIFFIARYIERKLTVPCQEPECPGKCFWEGWYEAWICEQCGKWIK